MSVDNLRIASINARGLKNKLKRIALFNYLKTEKIDIICIQEGHINKSDKLLWERQWGGKLYFQEGTFHSRGEIMLFSKKIDGEIKVLESCDRFMLLSVKYGSFDLAIANIYAPNDTQSKIKFFNDIEKILLEKQIKNLILMGDFNSVLDNKMDIVSGNYHNEREIKKFNNLIESLRVHDVWRSLHIEEKDFTFNRPRPFIARRLDYCFASSDILSSIISCEHKNVPNTDHKAVIVELNSSDFSRGPGYWRFNNSFIKDKNFCKQCNTLIDRVLQDEATASFTSTEKWEWCKMEIREFCIDYGKQKNRERNLDLILTQNNLRTVETLLKKDPTNDELNNVYIKAKQKIELIHLYKARGAQIRSRTKWIEDGEKNTKYFCNLEKHRSKQNIITRLEKEDGTIITNTQDILMEQVHFYKGLYDQKTEIENTKEAVGQFLGDSNFPRLSQEEKKSCEGKITLEETTSALNQLNNGSSPGCDGLTVEFMKCFWDKLGKLVTDSFLEAFYKGELSYTQNKGVIVLIHKGKDLQREKLNNWRPITLTNTDYKILAKALALRMATVASKLINTDQVGYLKGRNIATILRTIDDVISYLNTTGKSGYLLALDFNKAFDSISKQFLLDSFGAFGFGEEFIKWVKILMKGSNSCINYGGWLSESFDVKCGIRQGCPFSPLAFVLAVELMAIKIRNSNVKGVSLPGTENKSLKVKQLADDTTLFLTDTQDIEMVKQIIKDFGRFSGLQLNENKTNILPIGIQTCDNKTPFNKVTKIKILGIYFSNEKTAKYMKENWTGRLEKIKSLITNWSCRDLSIHGKIVIIKTFLISQFTFVMQSVGIPEEVLKEINSLLYKFLWQRRFHNKKAFEKIKRKVLQSAYSKGGLEMVDMLDLQKIYYLQWAGKLVSSEDNWTIIPYWCLGHIGSKVNAFEFNCRATSAKYLWKIKSEFWKTVSINVLDNKIIRKTEDINGNNILDQIIFNNACIKYKGSVLFFPLWQQRGIEKISSIVNMEEKRLLRFDEIKNIVNVNHPGLIFEYNALVNALPHSWIDIIFNSDIAEPVEKNSLETSLYNSKPKKIKTLINKLHPDLNNIKPYSHDFWHRKYGIEIDKDNWLLARSVTKEVRLLELHWKLLHNIYPTNILLNKMKVNDTNKCTYCIHEIDFIEHFFYNCSHIRSLWEYIELTLSFLLNTKIELNVTAVLLGYSNNNLGVQENNLINWFLLLGKMCVSIVKKTKCTIPIKTVFEGQLLLRSDQFKVYKFKVGIDNLS